jgi:hypothetical protein
MHGGHKKWYKISVGKPEEKRQLGGTNSRWEEVIKMVVKSIGCKGVDWI